MKIYDFEEFRDSRIAFYDFHDFRYSRMAFYDFHDFHDSHMDFYDFHYIRGLDWNSKFSMMILIIEWISITFFDFIDSQMEF